MRPHVILNAGMTLDGKIASKTGDTKISCKEDIMRVHELRKKVDGIMVGIVTAIKDDPKLTAHKAKTPGKNPTRIVVDSRARIPLDANVFKGAARTIIAVSKKAVKDETRKLKEIEKRAEVIICGQGEWKGDSDGDGDGEGGVDLKCLLEELYDRGIKSILLEGGGTLNWSMLEHGLVDRVSVAITPRIVGGKRAVSLVGGKGFETIAKGVGLELKKHYELGTDLILEYDVVTHNSRLQKQKRTVKNKPQEQENYNDKWKKMKIVKLSSKHQITLPRIIREDLGAKKGDRITYIKDRDKWVIVKLPRDTVDALRYFGKRAKLKGTVTEVHEEMEDWEK